MAHLELTHTLADAFNALADEVQTLSDRKTVLEHKLRFAHEQFQYLADKYAPATPEIAETLAKLQLPPHTSVDDTSPVPLPQRTTPQSQHQIAVVIRDGRRAASQLTSTGDASKTTGSSRDTLSQTSRLQTSMSTALEQDFTVEGRKGNLQCPFSKVAALDAATEQQDGANGDQIAHHGEDPVCLAMFDEATCQQPGASASKCPIRFLDKHSPEEIARYVESHKHELPRSHEICLRRYQRNEDQIKKLDSKYGSIVNMIEDLSQLHQPMLPEEDLPQLRSDVDRASNERVEDWAEAVSATSESETPSEAAAQEHKIDENRQGHFDRPLKEIRVGESPSRPWGISVPIYETEGQEEDHPLSPPPAPVRMPSPFRNNQTPVKAAGKCPFDHTKMSSFAGLASAPKREVKSPPATQHLQEPLFTPAKEAAPQSSPLPPRPTFLNPETATGSGSGQMIFTGPVFIGYPMDQAIQFMNQYRGNQ